MQEGYEQLLAYLESQLPRPVDRQDEPDEIHFLAGDPPEVMVTLTPLIVVVSEFAGEWDGPGSFRVAPVRMGVVHWPHLPENELLDAVAALVKAARRARLSRYETCRHCGVVTAPEWMHDVGVCQACAADVGGLIH